MRALELASGFALAVIFCGSVLLTAAGIAYAYLTLGPILLGAIACLVVAAVCFLLAPPEEPPRS